MTFWLLTSTFYGNWLPGDPRGFVSRVRDRRPGEPDSPSRKQHDQLDTPYDRDAPGLQRHAQGLLKCPPIQINADQAQILLRQFQETAAYRRWHLLAIAIMANHVHIVIGVVDNVDATKVLGDLKAYGSRALNRLWGKPASGTWWTYDGSKRMLPDDRAVEAAVTYVVEKQPNPLIVWRAEE